MMNTTPCKIRIIVSGLLIIAILTACAPSSNPILIPTPTSPPTQTSQPTETPKPTETPDPITAFADPILVAIQDRPPNFQDDFSSDSKGWLIKANAPKDLGNVMIANGGLIMNPGPGISGQADHYSTSIRDFVVQVDVDFLELNEPSAARLEWLRYVAYNRTLTTQGFDISNDGSWYLWSCPLAAPGNSPECQEGLPSGSVSVDLSDPVTFMLISKGTELAVYLNNTPLIYYNFLGQPPASHVRLFSWDDSEDPGHLGIVFDNFKIWELQSVFPPDPPDPTLGVGSSWERPADGMVMMYIPEGEFLMGSNDGEPNEQPVHAVYLDAFWIDRTEVTNAMFTGFLNEAGNQTEAQSEYLPLDHPARGVAWFNPYGARIVSVPGGDTWQPQRGYADHPVRNVNWYGAQAYCAWAGGRLPTEAEWEKAARGGLEGKLYPWGDEPPTCTFGASNGAALFWCPGGDIGFSTSGEYTVPVGLYAPNGFGLYDMVGNHSEWVADNADSLVDYYAYSPHRNPLGPLGELFGGKAWRGDPGRLGLSGVRIAWRGGSAPWSTNRHGFRCVRSP